MAQGYLLLVEDTDYLRSDIEELLTLNGYEVRAVANAERGLDILKTTDQPPVCIISDLLMPGQMNGYDLLEVVRKSPQWKDIPFIVLSGKYDNSLDAVLVKKPFLTSELLNTVAQCIGKANA